MAPSIELYVLEYSPSQRSFHIESVPEMLDYNLLGFHNRKLTDYLPLAISSDREKLDKLATRLKEFRDRRRDNPKFQSHRS